MTVHEEVRGGVCAKSSCHQAALARRIVRDRESVAELLERQYAHARNSLLPALGLAGPIPAAVAIVPATSEPVVKLPRERRIRFERHLAQLMKELVERAAAGTDEQLPEDESPGAAQFDDEPRALQDGCATCRGDCCRHGAYRQAFITVLTLRRYMAARPQLRPRDVVRAYLSRIPGKSVRESCVYHGATGCTLPRQMRAAICNQYHCDGLQKIQGLLEAPGTRKVLIVATTATAVVRWSVHDRNGDAAATAGRPPGDPGPVA